MPRFGQEFLPEDRDLLIQEAREDQHREAAKLPPGRRVGNLLKAAARHIADGMKKVSLAEYQERLNICNGCTPDKGGWRVKGVCTHTDCGCVLSKKCWWASEPCPEDKWPQQDESE